MQDFNNIERSLSRVRQGLGFFTLKKREDQFIEMMHFVGVETEGFGQVDHRFLQFWSSEVDHQGFHFLVRQFELLLDISNNLDQTLPQYFYTTQWVLQFQGQTS